jgi:hypothetical protein
VPKGSVTRRAYVGIVGGEDGLIPAQGGVSSLPASRNDPDAPSPSLHCLCGTWHFRQGHVIPGWGGTRNCNQGELDWACQRPTTDSVRSHMHAHCCDDSGPPPSPPAAPRLRFVSWEASAHAIAAAYGFEGGPDSRAVDNSTHAHVSYLDGRVEAYNFKRGGHGLLGEDGPAMVVADFFASASTSAASS